MAISTDTIAAISTAPGTGAIAVVRLSGSDALAIAERVFSVSQPTKRSYPLPSHVARHGLIVDPDSGSVVDEVVLTPFHSPKSYTGEHLVEIACHGSPIVTGEILALLLRQGARLARQGEFTERAFLNGRIDLTQAEAVLDLIQAKTTRQSRAALSALSGYLGERIAVVRSDLLATLTRVVAGLDFPEEIGDAPEPQIDLVVRRSKASLEELAGTARSGKFLREGLKLAIVGRPNAGKSSLLNQLLKFDRAIVTDVPGTTRDSLEELLDLNGIPIVLVDTAGIRPTEDTVERIGIERTKKAIREADLILFVVDLDCGWGSAEDEIALLIEQRPYIIVGNKIDLVAENGRRIDPAVQQRGNAAAAILVSARRGDNLDELTAAVENWVFSDSVSRESVSLNARQAQLCQQALKALDMVESTLVAGYPQDCLATDLKSAIDALSEMSGESVSEEVISQVFATFCIGK